MIEDSPQREYWSQIARHWALLGPPLRPSEEDIAGYRRGISEFQNPRAAILGVTQEICRMEWPASSSLIAIDHNASMIEAVWPGPREIAIRGDWQALPLSDSSRGLVLCDGGLSVLAFPKAATAMIASVKRVLTNGGLGLFRLYVPAGSAETEKEVLDQLLAGNIPSLNHLKLRLGMAMQVSSCDGVELSTIWQALHDRAPDFAALAESVGWELDHLLAINAYRDSRTRYYFPTLDEVVGLFEEADFRKEWISTPAYPMGERCPVVCFRKVG